MVIVENFTIFIVRRHLRKCLVSQTHGDIRFFMRLYSLEVIISSSRVKTDLGLTSDFSSF